MKFLFWVFLIALGVLLYKKAKSRQAIQQQDGSAAGPLLGKAQFGIEIDEAEYLPLSDRVKRLPQVLDTGYEELRQAGAGQQRLLWIYCEPEHLSDAKQTVAEVLAAERGDDRGRPIHFLER